MESPEGGFTHIRLVWVWTDIELCQCRSMDLLLSSSLSRSVSSEHRSLTLLVLSSQFLGSVIDTIVLHMVVQVAAVTPKHLARRSCLQRNLPPS
jgi:hypothetical protein